MSDDLSKILYPLAARSRKNAVAFWRKKIKDDPKSGPVKHDRNLSKELIARHVRGEGDPLGFYFMEPGAATTRLGLLDFDDHDAEFEFESVMDIAFAAAELLTEAGIVTHPWRSGGGNGVHLWMLWDEPQDAFSVRGMLRGVIEGLGYKEGRAGVGAGQIEIYPAQDEVPEGGFGNPCFIPLARASAPLLEKEDGSGYVLGSREDVADGYEWAMSAPVAVLERPVRKLLPSQAQNQGLSGQDINIIEEQLGFIKFDRSDDYSYGLWIKVGMALHGALGGSEDGFQLWAAWSARGASCPPYGELEAKWNSFGRRGEGAGVGGGTLKMLAREGGWAEDVSGDFEDLVAVGQAKGETPPVAAPIIKNEKDHLAIGRMLVSARFERDGLQCLWRAASSADWFVYNGKCYDREIDEIITNGVRLWLSGAKKVVFKGKGDKKEQMAVPFDPSPSAINAVFGALKTIGAPSCALEPPQWIGQERRTFDFVSLGDGILDLRGRHIYPHTPKFFSVNTLPYAWGLDAEAGCVLWQKFLGEVFPDRDSIDCLQEIFGYLLSADTSLQKMFLIRGLPRSGKGTIERVLRAMLGDRNVAGTTLNQLGEDFGLWPLIDKSVVFISEARNTRNSLENRMTVAVERLLMISGEDNILANVKGGRYYEGRLGCRIVLTANEVPALGDSTGAFASRFITLTTRGSWLGKEDADLTYKLKGELPGILRWSLDGLDRLRTRGRFLQPASGAEVMDELADAQNPIRRFLKEACVLGEGAGSVDKQKLYSVYRGWFMSSGMAGKATSQNWFAKGLKTAYRELTKEFLVEGRAGAEESRFYSGLSLTEFAERTYSIF